MNPIASVGLGGPLWTSPASVPAAVSASGGSSARDAQMAELGTTSSSVNALQSMAMSASAPITIPQNQNFQPPVANTSNELVDAMSGGSSED